MKLVILRYLWCLLYRSKIVILLSDLSFTKVMYFCHFCKRLNIDCPEDFNEKIQWLKLYYRNNLYVTCADKYAVREFVREKIGEKQLNKCIGVYERIDDIKFTELPERFALKATHGSGWNIVCSDKRKLNWKSACRRMRRWLKSDFSRVGREWQYHEIKPRVICEAFMEESDGSSLVDYKLYTFKGDVKYIAVEFNGNDGRHYINIYDSGWKFQPDKKLAAPNAPHLMQDIPGCLEELKEVARKLSADFPMCRVDLYVVGGKKIIFGELTFTPGKGCNAFSPQTFCDELGNYIELPERSWDS